jgi:divalent metal cation (Fe/Co/Zn/Cd) transporter
MPEFIQIATPPRTPAGAGALKPGARVIWLQSVTLVWMLAEFGISAYAAMTARSLAMAAFGSDSLVELLSATVVLLQWTPGFSISTRKAGRIAGALLFALSFVVGGIAIASVALRWQPGTTRAGILITTAALIAMPVLAWLKRREARRVGNAALAADAVQSAACAYIALVALTGLLLNATFHIAWFDSIAALAALPFLIKEGRSAWQGYGCGCC